MRIHLAGPTVAPTLTRRVRAPGDTLSQGGPVPLDADVYVFGSGDEAMRSLTHGLVILDLRADLDLTSAAWSAYADLCVVGSTAARAALAEIPGCEPERIFVATDQATILDLAHRALRDELPPATVEKRGTPMTDNVPTPLDPTTAPAARLEALTCQAEIMDRGYEVRSRLPLVGPLVAWIRRNLTSHLREPYLDPTLERQIAFNRTAVAWIKDAEARLQA
ncbi:MAG: hypothetical protein ACP5JJ_13690, partial [Anaerolineae bacterium]